MCKPPQQGVWQQRRKDTQGIETLRRVDVTLLFRVWSFREGWEDISGANV